MSNLGDFVAQMSFSLGNDETLRKRGFSARRSEKGKTRAYLHRIASESESVERLGISTADVRMVLRRVEGNQLSFSFALTATALTCTKLHTKKL